MTKSALLALLLVAAAVPARAQEAPLLRHTFAADTDNWTGAGEVAKVDRTADPKIVRGDGRSALRFEYEVDRRSLNLLALPVAPGAWAQAGRIAFAARASVQTPIAVTLQEKDGGRWTALFLAPKDAWQEVVLDPADFVLGREADAPADANGRLDMDRIENCALLDISQLFVRSDNPALQTFFPVAAGPRTLYLSDFEVRPAPTPASLDGLHHPQIGWFPLGGLRLTRIDAAASPLKGVSLRADYAVGPAKLGGLVRPLPADALTRAKTLSLHVAAEKATTLVVQVEDAAGGKFAATVAVPEGRAATRVEIALDDLKPTDDSKTRTLDRGKVTQILVLDASGVLQGAEGENTLWLRGLEAR